MKHLFAILRGWCSRCPDCNRWQLWTMTDGSRICHWCALVQSANAQAVITTEELRAMTDEEHLEWLEANDIDVDWLDHADEQAALSSPETDA